MKELQVPTREIHAELYTVAGEHFRGRLYLAESPFLSGGPDDVIESLNDDRAFVPFSVDEPDEGRVIVGKEHILRIRLDEVDSLLPVLTTEIDAEPERTHTFLLADGSCLAGQIYLDTPTESSRALDKLNLAARFMVVLTEHGVELIQKRRIARVS